MKVLWVGNIILPQIAEYEKVAKPVVGGWMVYLADLLAAQSETSLVYIFDASTSRYGNLGAFSYYAIERRKDSGKKLGEYYISQIKQVLAKESPDVIHIWGTENEHALAVIEVAKAMGIDNRVIISIQGMLSVYSKSYFASLPLSVVYGFSFKDLLLGNVWYQKRVFERKGKIEIEAIKKVSHVIGRTDWDRANVWSINPNVRYHFNNEILRKEFYTGEWNYDNCEKHSIFCSQAHYPIKGIHFMIQALKIVKRQYSDVKLYIGGKDYSTEKKIKLNTYQQYVLGLIKKNDLEENVVFTGFLDASKMKERFLKSNVFVSPSSIENSPNSVGEAMLLGVPIVSSCVGGVHNMLTHGEQGFLYPTDEICMLAYYICLVFDQKERIASISRSACERAKITHSVETNLSGLLNIYKEISEGNNEAENEL